MLECRGISKRFGGLVVLDDVSMKISEWEIVGLIGPNGAGKTTLFNCLTGFYRPDAGRVLFLGEDITERPTHRRTAMGIGRTFQQVGLVRSLNVLENLVLAQHAKVRYSAFAGLTALPVSLHEERELAANAREILAFLGLQELEDASITELPYGRLKLVELAQALATDPVVMLLDEPSSGMGPEEIERLGELILRLRDDLGMTVLVIEHHVPLVLKACDYAYVLNIGRLLAEGRPEQIKSHPDVIAAYLGSREAV